MRDFVILTDSCCDFSAQMVEELELSLLPLSFVMEGKEYFDYPDHRDIQPDEFYQRLRSGSLGTTAAISVGVFHEAMEPIAASGKDILCVSFSSGLSTTYQSACIAAQEIQEAYPDCKVLVVDSRAASLGQGLLVYLTVQEKRKGRSIEEVRDFVERTKLHMAHWFTVDDLTYLKRGGRVSPTAAAVGTMLNIKPVLHVDDEGHLIPMEKVRGRKAALAALVRQMRETVVNPEEQTVVVSHSRCQEEAERLQERILEEFHPKEVLILELGPIIGAHTGPGLMALFFLAEHR